MANGKSRRGMARLIDVAREAGVSRATASLVMRDSPLVAQETRFKVLAATERLGYVRNMTAARLRSRSGGIAGVIVPNLRNPFFAELFAGIEEALEEHGLAVLIGNSHDDRDRQADLMRRMCEHGVDGIIFCPAVGTARDWRALPSMRRLPCVQVLRHVVETVDYVGVDYRGGMWAAVEALVGLGHRHIAFAIQEAEHSALVERLEGYNAAIEAFGLQAPHIVKIPESFGDMESRVTELLDATPAPTATICFNDVVAFHLAAAFRDRGLLPGHDHALIGFDDVQAIEVLRPRMASVATHPGEVGRAAARRMLFRVEQPDAPAERIVLPTELVLRPSAATLLQTGSRTIAS